MSLGVPYVYRFISLIYDPQKNIHQQIPIPKSGGCLEAWLIAPYMQA